MICLSDLKPHSPLVSPSMLRTSWKPERAASSSLFSKKPVVVEGSEGAGVV